MFEDLNGTNFNPMRDVWFPLDLSNASSFNCVMAHAAAHLAHLYAGTCPKRGTKSSDALKYKAEAVRILRSWLADPKEALSDDAFAAVIRLLTFEVRIPEPTDPCLLRLTRRLMILYSEILGHG